MFHSNRIVRIIFLIVLLAFGDKSSASEPLRIVTPDMPPFGFVAEDGQKTGMLYEMGNQIAQESGFSYENRIVPFARLIEDLTTGRADMGIFLHSKENEKSAVKVANIFTLKNIIIGLKGTAFKSLNDLHGKTVATVRGAIYDEAFTADTAILKYETNNYQQSLRMLVHKRLDAVIGPEIGLMFTAKMSEYPGESFGEPFVINTKEAWLQFSIKTAEENKDKIEALKAAAEKLLQNGTVSAVMNEYR